MNRHATTNLAEEKADFFHQQALRFVTAGQIASAVEWFQKAVDERPDRPSCHFNLALALHQLKRTADAIRAYQQAVELAPDFFDAWNNLSTAYKESGKLNEALDASQRAVNLRPNAAGAHLNLGNIFKASGNPVGAEQAYRRALALDAGCYSAHSNLAALLDPQNRYDEALQHAAAAVKTAPNNADAHNNFGVLLHAQGRSDQAIAEYRQAIDLSSTRPDFWSNLGKSYVHTHQLDAADEAYACAVKLDPQFAEAHYGRGWVALLKGDLGRGWQGYDWRLKTRRHAYAAYPQWKGQELQGESVLVHAEQGFGDTIQFARFLPMLARKGGRFIVQCQPELKQLLQTIPGSHVVFAEGEPLPRFDLQIAMGSLPGVFDTTLESIPDQVPYLFGDPSATVVVPSRVPNQLKVGLVWAGSRSQANDRNRSMSGRDLGPLLAIPNVTFYSLQVGRAFGELAEAGGTEDLIDLSPQLSDFSVTAAALQQLDLIVSVDTAVAHLAGALGKPAWVLLCFAADWRWLLDREDSPWYPTLRLYRQTTPRDWSSVVERVACALKTVASSRMP